MNHQAAATPIWRDLMLQTAPQDTSHLIIPVSQPIVMARDVVKTYDTGKVRVQALRGVTLAVKRGEMIGVMGPSGCGKTTLLNCLSGLDDVTSGSIVIEGVSLETMSDHQRTDYRARRMGFIFQFYNLLPDLNAVENVELPLLVAGEKTRIARERAQEALEMVGLSGQLQQQPGELSGGQRQRVTIARALVNKPAIVWGDEPTGDLDSETATEIVALMRRLNQQEGLTFVVVTHDPAVGRAMDRIVHMRDGIIEADGTIAAVRA
jgi:putative ABC transport system ATP-binding protein